MNTFAKFVYFFSITHIISFINQNKMSVTNAHRSLPHNFFHVQKKNFLIHYTCYSFCCFLFRYIPSVKFPFFGSSIFGREKTTTTFRQYKLYLQCMHLNVFHIMRGCFFTHTTRRDCHTFYVVTCVVVIVLKPHNEQFEFRISSNNNYDDDDTCCI